MRRSMTAVLLGMMLVGSASVQARTRQAWQTRDGSARLERTGERDATALRFEAAGLAVQVRYEMESEEGPFRMRIDAPEGRFEFRAGIDGKLLEGEEDVRSWVRSNTFRDLRRHAARLSGESPDPQLRAELMILVGDGGGGGLGDTLGDLNDWWAYQTCFMQKDELVDCIKCCDRTGAVAMLLCTPATPACAFATIIVVIYCHATCEVANPV